ncbi:MAG: DUF1538 family protein, partial [Thiomicrorhabdus sp.]|nr:DUF1538 family protein [Thiomicrorhabdus sp.]
MELLNEFLTTTLNTVADVIPIAAIIFGFQFLVIRRPIPNLKRVLIGFAYVLVGLSLFLLGLEKALFPLGRLMADQLTNPAFIYEGVTNAIQTIHWADYYWVYIFAFAIGF